MTNNRASLVHFDSDVVVINESARSVDPSTTQPDDQEEQPDQAKSFHTTEIVAHRHDFDCGDTGFLNNIFPKLEPISWSTFAILTFCASFP